MEDPDTAPVVLTPSNNTLTGGYASTYTSWGPTFEAEVKPQLASPGGNILSTYPVALGSYAVLSGTSMACPLVAAVYALVAEVRGTFTPSVLENVLSATSKPAQYNDGTGTYDVIAPVAQQGSGLIQAYDAAYASTILSASSLSFNDTTNLVPTLNFTISNLGSEDVTYELGSYGAATGYTFSTSVYPDIFPGLEVDDSYASISFGDSKVTVAAGGEEVVTVTVTPPAINATRLPVYSGYVTLNGTNGDALILSYQGIVGSLYSTTVLGSSYLALSTDADLTPITTSNTSFVIYKANNNSTAVAQPVAVADMAFGSPLIKYEAISTSNGTQNLGQILGSPITYASRDPQGAQWNGTLADGTYAPAGKYKIAISALHIQGDASDTADYDAGETVEFRISYT
jgi:hypothetical protein